MTAEWDGRPARRFWSQWLTGETPVHTLRSLHALTRIYVIEYVTRMLVESTLRNPVRVAGKTSTKATAIIYWIGTALFCLQMSFTAYAQLSLAQVAEAFTHLGFPAYFRVELSWAKLLGVALLLAPVPVRLKEWAYAGFAINLASALIAHLSVGDGPESWSWPAATGVLWGLSYFFWRRLQATAASA